MKDGMISIYDAIVAFKGCNRQRAREIWSRMKSKFNSCNWLQFPRKNGQMGNPVPCCTFTNLLKILSQVPGEEARVLRAEQAELSVRSIVGDRDLQDAMEENRKRIPAPVREVLETGLEHSSKRKREDMESMEYDIKMQGLKLQLKESQAKMERIDLDI